MCLLACIEHTEEEEEEEQVCEERSCASPIACAKVREKERERSAKIVSLSPEGEEERSRD